MTPEAQTLHPPEGFERIDERRRQAWVERRLLTEPRSTALLVEAQARRALAGARGPRGRTRTARTSIGDANLMLRPVRHGGILGPWLRSALWGPARPLDELRVHVELWKRGAPVPKPAFAVAWRRCGPVWWGLYATHEEPDACDAAAFLAAAPAAPTLRGALVALGQTLRRFHDCGGLHRDLNLRNLLVREHAVPLEIVVIDLDRAIIQDPLPPRERMRQWMRLYRSVLKEGAMRRVGIRGCALAFRAYWGGDRALRDAMLRHLPIEKRRVALHALHYRA
jgi:3-deoxy-D-manno-octulosonic acid kinase